MIGYVAFMGILLLNCESLEWQSGFASEIEGGGGLEGTGGGQGRGSVMRDA
jgi:hypothetical protein